MQDFFLITAILLGLSSGAGCLGVCAPYLVPLVMSKERSIKHNSFIVAEYLAGRLIAYIAVALAAGFTGVHLSEIQLTQKLTGVLMMIVAVFLFISMMAAISKHKHAVHKAGRTTPFLVGILNGLHVCPPFLAAIAYVITLKSVVKSVAFFSVFFIGTAIYTIPFIFIGCFSRFERVRNAGQIAGILVSVWIFVYGIIIILR